MLMAGEMICPDCGGVVGATETTSAGAPCSCFITDNRSADTAVDLPSPTGPAQPKVCVLCGKDVTGHRRVKDSRGYVCYDCAKDEQKRGRDGKVRCRSCNRLVKEETLVKTETTKMCARCHAEQLKKRKQEIRQMGIATAHKQFERGRLYLFLAVGVILLLIMVLSHLHVLPSL
jgi:hypothetical protein